MIAPAIPPQEEARVEALRKLHILDTPTEDRFERLTGIAMAALQMPMASVSLIDTDRQWCKSSPGMAKPSVDRHISFCGHTILQETPLIIPDATKDIRFHDNPLVTQKPRLRAYIGIPLMSEDGYCVGSFCVLDSKPRNFTTEQIEIMRSLASLAERELQNVALSKSLEEARVARQAAEDAVKAKSAFLAMMSHEIRTPMNGVLGIADILAGTELTSTQREYVNLVQMSGNTLLALINDILDFSKIESGRLELESLPLSPRPFLKETLALQIHAAHAKGLTLESEVDAAVPESFMGDGCRLRQIIINLVGNALKFTKKGVVRVEVGMVKQDDQQRIIFQVKDTGVGIAPENLEKLFQAYSQAEASTSRHYGGTGLGLSISKLLVELMGGAIWVESVPGQGSTFSFTIPCQPCEASTVLAEQKSGPVPETNSRRQNWKILVVEDNPINQRVVTLFLKKLGCDAECVSSGASCIEKAARKDYDIIFMDVHMPDMDGHETTRRIRLHSGAIHPWIVALTASAQDNDSSLCLKSGMNDFLTKPLRLEALSEALGRYENRALKAEVTLE
jgi:signal transduction histidine kinase/ActR/RegA family two-component response regulator